MAKSLSTKKTLPNDDLKKTKKELVLELQKLRKNNSDSNKLLQSKIKKALKENERRFNTLLNNVPGMAYRCSNTKDWKMEFISDGCLSLTGYHPNQFVNNNYISYEEIIHKDDRKIVWSKIQTALENKIPFQISYRIITASGREKWVWEQGCGIYTKTGSLLALEGFIFDITRHKSAEDALTENETFLRTLVHAIPDFVWLKNINGVYLTCNHSFERFFGSKEEDIIGKTDYDFVDKELADFFREHDNLAIKLQKPNSNEEWVTYAEDGRRLLLETIKTPLIDNNGKLIGVLGIGRDITERKRIEEELRFRNILLTSQQEASIDGILVVDEFGKIILFNNRFVEMWKIPEKVIASKSDKKTLKSVLINLVDPNLFIQKIKYLYLHKELKSQDEIELSDGRTFDRYSAPMFNNDKYYGRIWYFRDITQRKSVEKELEKHKNELEMLVESRTLELEKVNELLQEEIIKQKEVEEIVKQSLEKEKQLNELKTRFISIASHEFRTPLTTILSSAQLLERYHKIWDTDNIKIQFARIKDNIKQLTETMDDVLTISRTETGKIIFEPKEIELKYFCDEIVDNIRVSLLPNQNLIYKLLTQHKKFLLDVKLLKQIMLNLLSNAIKYSKDDSEIEFIIKEESNRLTFRIKDYGIGIPQNDIETLFEPFHRGKNVGSVHGTGLGMSIVKRSIEMHNGKLEFETEEGFGTTFLVTIPI